MQVKVRALLWVDDRLVVYRERRQESEIVTLPGGRVLDRETLADALRREVAEELGVDVEPGELRFVAEVVHGHTVHDVNLVFDARLRTLGDVGRLELVDPRSPEAAAVRPPILGAVAADAGSAAAAPRWLGNVWRSGL